MGIHNECLRCTTSKPGRAISSSGFGSGVFQLKARENTARQHFQNYVTFSRKETKKKWIRVIIHDLYPRESLTFEAAQDIEKLKQYCQKSDTRVEDPWFFGDFVDESPNHLDLNIELFQWQKDLWEIIKVSCNLKNQQMVLIFMDGPEARGKSKLPMI